MHHYSHELNLCTEKKSIIENSSTINQHLPMISPNPVSRHFIYSNSISQIHIFSMFRLQYLVRIQHHYQVSIVIYLCHRMIR